MFTDHNAPCPWYTGMPLTYRPPDALVAKNQTQTQTQTQRTSPAFYALSRHCRLHPATQAVHDTYPETAPATHFSASQRTQTSVPTLGGARVVHEAPGISAQDEAQAFVRQAAQASGAQADVLHFAGTVPGLGAATCFSLDARGFSRNSSGDYLIVGLSHQLDQRATQVGGEQAGAHKDTACPCTYTCTGQAIARTTAYRPLLPALPDIPMNFTARIESDGPYARLDAQGRYRLRALFDTARHAHTEASVALRRLTPYAGPPGALEQAGQASGLHTPLHDGDEVLLGCLDGDPERPYIVATLPNAERPGPLSARNKAHNALHTAADNALDLDDSLHAEVITLRTYAGHTILQLDAGRLGQHIALAARHGAVHLFAKQCQRLRCADLTERSGDTRTQIVQDAHTTTTHRAEIHHQGATDVELHAHASITTASGEHTTLRGAKRVRIRAQRDVKVTVKGPGGLVIHVRNGTVHAQAAKAIRIEGQGGGDIIFEQSGAGFKIDTGGHIHLWGNKVAINGPVNYQGPVHYEAGAVSTPEPVSVDEALCPADIPELRDEHDPQIIDLAWDESIVALGIPIGLMFSVKNFQGGETAVIHIHVITPDGRRQEVDTVRSILNEGTGHYTLSWTSQAGAAALELDTDDNSQDYAPAPLRYVFDVHVEEHISTQSAPLLLSSDVECILRYVDGASLENDTPAQLIDAQGTLHTANIEQGSVVFKDVIIGPWRLEAGSASSYTTD